MSTSSLAAGSLVGDSRGLTAAGAVALALGLGLLGGVYDIATGTGLSTAFAVCFVVACVIGALRVHHEDLVAVVVMPPLVYVAIALFTGLVEGSAGNGSFVTSQALELFNALVLGAPVLMTATGATVVLAAARQIRSGRRTA